MDTKVCQYILEIARNKSITKAAESLNISQSALSQCLLRVERDMGAQLFNRKKTSLTLTDAGKLYVQAAEKVVETKNRLRADIAALSKTHKIRIGVSSMWGMDMMMELLPKFKDAFPDVMVEMKNSNFSNLSVEYNQKKIDMAVTSLIPNNVLPGICEPLRNEELKLIINRKHPFAEKHRHESEIPRELMKTELADVEMIRAEQGATIHEIENQLFDELQFMPRTICEIGDYMTFIRLVEGGMGYALVSGDNLEAHPGIRSWSLSPKLERVNAMFVQPVTRIGTPEEYLINLIRNYRLFK
ncbi:MAG: LysR family transcriptional regulator [Oscillospiraceae bacterium]